MMKLIELNIDKIIALYRKYKVAKLWAFGSILTDRFNDKSDVDLIVDFEDDKIDLPDYADNFLGFVHAIEDVIGRKIDLIVDKYINNRVFRNEVDRTRKLLWSLK